MQGKKVSLSHTLLLLAHCAPLGTLPKALRAVTTILEDEEARHTVDTIIQKMAEDIKDRLQSSLRQQSGHPWPSTVAGGQ